MFRRTGLLLAFTAALAVLVSVGGVSGATSSGITRDYEIVVTRKKISPDGVEKTIVGADVFSKDAGSRSGSTKAPLISDWYPVMKGSKNDLFRFKVTNNLTTTKMYDEIRRSSPRGAIGGPVGRALHDAKGPATSIHLHGLGFSDGHQFYDGPAFITQCKGGGGTCRDRLITDHVLLPARPHQGRKIVPVRDPALCRHKRCRNRPYLVSLLGGRSRSTIADLLVFPLSLSRWHSHMQLQYTDGLLGALMIDDPNSPHKGKWDEEVIIILSDHWHLQSEEVLMLRFDPAGPAVWGPKGDPLIPDSFFINGKGRFNCSNPVPKGMKCNSNQPWPEFKFTKGKRYLLRIINAATASAFWFSIDNHPLHVVQADHTWTRKATFDRIFVDVAQRYSVIVEATSHPRSLAWMRADFEFAYYPAPAPLLPKSTFGIVRYEKASKTKEPTSIAKRKPKSLGMNGELQLVPFNAKPAPPVGQKMRIKYALNFTTFRWEMNGKGCELTDGLDASRKRR